MREIEVKQISEAVAKLCMEANFELPSDVLEALKEAVSKEESPLGVDILNQLIENVKVAAEKRLPICQDTGYNIIFIELGQDARIIGGDFYQAINDGLRKGTKEGYLRCSILNDPLERKNTGDNTPAVIHTEIVPGDKLKITVAPKGGGSENMSALIMLKPGDGIEGIKHFVLEQVKKAGANPCPPIIVGVGLGGTFEKAALLAKKALLRPLGTRHGDKKYAELEQKLLNEINKLGLGPEGLGGRITALAVHIETWPCHLASLPIAVNLQCHAARHKEIVL
ncbi:MAG: fumarate hydratase [bacterium]